MSGSPYRIVLERTDGRRFYYSREIEARDRYNVACTQPFFDEDVRQAKKFVTPTEAIARRDVFRKTWPKDRFFVESVGGGDPLFEERSAEVAPTDSTDTRTSLFLIPDDLLESRLGFLVRPGYTSSLGRCWCVRACDVPSLNEETPSALESVFDNDPEWALYKARIAWGVAMKPFANPFPQVQAERQIQIHNPRRAGIRPGDRR
jgi:hypothetical protein